mmetsp:Transcript_6184/g.10985  ORF Transcript_6184/g.10985 Transcript_6184/m.10985 type:complete len:432 (+) Transcript_6184:273-1568(+)
MRETVPAGGELRFETESRTTGPEGSGSSEREILTVTRGSAEVNGVELLYGFSYRLLPNRSYGVYSWSGCEVELNASFCKGVYTSEETPMIQVAKIHQNLQLMRERGTPPRVAIVGPPNCGKTTLARTLVAYTIRSGFKSVLLDLDVAKNSIGLPGSIGANVFESPVDLVTETGDLGFTAGQPLVYFVGVDKLSDNTKRFKEQTLLLNHSIEERRLLDPPLRSGGVIMDSFSWSSTPSVHNALMWCLEQLEVNVVLVLDNDRLLAEVKRKFEGATNPPVIIKVPRSGGVVENDASAQKRESSNRIREYFEGPRGHLAPHRLELKLGEDVQIFLTKQVMVADSSLRPIGTEVPLEEEKRAPQLKSLDKSLESSLLAVVHATSETDVLTSPVAGFVHIESVDLVKETISILVPSPNELVSRFLLLGKVKYFEAL